MARIVGYAAAIIGLLAVLAGVVLVADYLPNNATQNVVGPQTAIVSVVSTTTPSA